MDISNHTNENKSKCYMIVTSLIEMLNKTILEDLFDMIIIINYATK